MTRKTDITITPTRASQVNKVLRSLGITEYLVRGNGYWYFDGGDSSAWYSSSVPVYRITAGTIGWWITEWLALAATNSEYSVKYGEMDSIVITNVLNRSTVTFLDPIEAIRWFTEKTSDFFVTIDGERQYFSTLEDATKFVSEYFKNHNVILGIERK